MPRHANLLDINLPRNEIYDQILHRVAEEA